MGSPLFFAEPSPQVSKCNLNPVEESSQAYGGLRSWTLAAKFLVSPSLGAWVLFRIWACMTTPVFREGLWAQCGGAAVWQWVNSTIAYRKGRQNKLMRFIANLKCTQIPARCLAPCLYMTVSLQAASCSVEPGKFWAVSRGCRYCLLSSPCACCEVLPCILMSHSLDWVLNPVDLLQSPLPLLSLFIASMNDAALFEPWLGHCQIWELKRSHEFTRTRFTENLAGIQTSMFCFCKNNKLCQALISLKK